MAKTEGKKGGLYLNEGNYAVPSLTKIPGVRDLKQGADWDTIDSVDRDSDIKTYMLSQMDIPIEFDIIWNPSQALHVQMREDAIAGTSREYFCLAGANVAGILGWRGEFLLTGFPMDMALTDGMKVSLKLLPYAGYTNAPASYTVP